MARIRTIKPQFWTNEELSLLSESACLLAIALLNHVDDEGYFNANPKLVESACFPIRELSTNVRRCFDELSNVGYLEFAVSEDNRIYGRIAKFLDHQKIDRPQKSKIADLQLVWSTEMKFDEHSTNHQRALVDGIRNKEREKEEGKGRRNKESDENFISSGEEKKISEAVLIALDAEEKKEKKAQGGGEFFSKARESFEKLFREKTETAYYFQGKDGKAIKGIEKKIEHLIHESGKTVVTDESKLSGFNYFLNAAWETGDNWLRSNFSLSNLESRFSTIIANYKTLKNGTQNTKTTKFTTQRDADFAEVAELRKFAQGVLSTASTQPEGNY